MTVPESVEDDVAVDESSWESPFGDCVTYAKGAPNHGFCEQGMPYRFPYRRDQVPPLDFASYFLTSALITYRCQVVISIGDG